MLHYLQFTCFLHSIMMMSFSFRLLGKPILRLPAIVVRARHKWHFINLKQSFFLHVQLLYYLVCVKIRLHITTTSTQDNTPVSATARFGLFIHWTRIGCFSSLSSSSSSASSSSAASFQEPHFGKFLGGLGNSDLLPTCSMSPMPIWEWDSTWQCSNHMPEDWKQRYR